MLHFPTTGRAKFGGALAAAAKAFEEAAQGGMVLAGTQTFMQVSECMQQKTGLEIRAGV
jgi:hypothetical protein